MQLRARNFASSRDRLADASRAVVVATSRNRACFLVVTAESPLAIGFVGEAVSLEDHTMACDDGITLGPEK
jgi:hypothetical protein